MYFAEKPTNTTAHASNGMERSRWRDEGVDPELVADPFDTLQACQKQAEHVAAILRQSAERPLSAQVAAMATRRSFASEGA